MITRGMGHCIVFGEEVKGLGNLEAVVMLKEVKWIRL
jgi:hypothetical protein